MTMLIATGVMTCASMAPAMAAPNVDASATVNVGKKAAVNVAENAKVNVKKDAKVNVEESAELTVKNGAKVTFSKDAGIGFENGAKINLGSKAGVTLADGAKLSVAKGSNVSVDKNITMGNGAVSSPYVGQTGNVAIGEKALAWNGNGLQEGYMDFGQGGATITPGFIKDKVTINDGTKLPGSIAIGKNTVARSGSTMIGDHGYTGKIGDTTITPDGNGIMKYNNDVYSTTIGANSFNSGALASVTGVFSIASSQFDGSGGWNTSYAVQNTGATIYGSMNSIESATSSSYSSGIASSVLGFANRTQNANAALIWGTGNEVTNSVETIDIDYNGWNKLSVAEAQQKAIEAMQSSKYAGGSVMAIGGGNKADYAKYSQLTGVQNKVTGTKDKAAKYDFVNGYQNTVTNASDVTVIGIKNEVTADGNKVIGDNHKVSGKNNVIFGSADKVTETTVNNAVVLGHNAKVTGEGGVALGAGSVANRANAVSVGSKDANRQIINVAAGKEDTDAVNVSQLKDVKAEAGKHTTLSDGKNTKVEPTVTAGQTDYKVNVAGDLTDITSVANGGAKLALNGAAGTAGIINGQGASVVMLNGSTIINGVVGIDNTGKISGVANGEADKDAVNYGQLKDVKAEAEKHSVVTDSANITVTPEKATDGRMQYNVALNNDITLAGDDPDAYVSISGSKGTIWASGSVTAGSVVAGDVVMDGATATVSGLSNKTTAYEDFATTGKAATEEQLKEVATEAGKHTQVKAGTNVGIVPGETEDGTHVYTVNADGTTVSGDSNVVVTPGEKDANNVTNYGVKLNKDLKGIESVSNGSASLKLSSNPIFGATAVLTNGKASVELRDSTTIINGQVQVRQDGTIGGVTAGRADKDAVNVSQLKDVKAEAGKHTTLSNGKNTTVEAAVKDGQTDYKVNVAGDLTDITSVANGGAKLALDGAAGTAGIINGQGASVYMQGSTTVINRQVSVDKDGKISGVAAGTADTDAVNYGQLKNISAAATAAKTEIKGGTNIANVDQTTADDGHMVYTVNANGTTVSGDSNVAVTAETKDNNVTNYAVKLNKDLKGIESVSNGSASLTMSSNPIFGATAKLTNGKASVELRDSTTIINGKVQVRQDGSIGGVTAGRVDNDAVNLGQLKDVKAEAGKHTTLSNGKNTTVEAAVKDGQTDYKVNVAGDLTDISSVANGDAKLALNGAAGTAGIVNGKGASVYMQDGYTVINSKVSFDQDGKISGVAAGVNNDDAVNVSQLKKVEEAAGNANKGWNLSTNGVATEATNVKPGDNVDFSGDKNISVSNDGTKVKVELNKNLKDIETISNGGATLTLGAMGGMVSEFANGQGASVKLFGDTTIINGKVNVYKDGRIAGVADGVNANDAVNVSQLQKAAAASATTVSDGVNTTVTATKAEDGHTDYKVNLNKDLVGIESISNAGASLTMNGIATELANGQGASVKLFGDTTTINNAVTVYKDGRISGVADGINNNDAVNVGQLNKVSEIANKGWNLATNGVATEATNVKPGDYVDFSGDKNISVSHDGTKVKVELNKDLNVNSVQTNALNSKYNLSVGTMAENGIMPFFVNSTGAFYAAHNKFSVDKDGNMNANSVQTNALNSKYNLSVGTANENGTVPFFVNSTGAFYAANNNFSVDKDGKVIATAGEIGNVVLNNGVFTGHSALRDGELFVGDASGNYSQITTKGAKLGKVTIAEDGKISGVAAGEVSSTSTDAINGSQLHQTNENVAALDKRVTQNEADIATNKANIAQNAADIAANKANIAQNKADIATNKADIATNKADIATNKANIAQNAADIKKVEALAKKHTTVTEGKNIKVTEGTNADGGKEYNVALDKDINLDSVTTGQTVMNNDGLKVGKDVSVTATAVTAGKTSISDEGVKVGDKTYISDKGLNANDQKVTNVAAGEISATSKDAVNGSQLYATNQEVANNTNRINKLGSRVNKVGAGAAALAALHPMDFDPDDKLTFSAGYGNYAGENAAAIGAYYRPDEKVMFSVAGTVGNGENMVNAGVSFALDRSNHVSNSRTALAREVIDLRGQLAVMGAKMAKMEKAFGMLDETKTKLFPDVPANHWAYEYIAKLAGNGYIEGYPDGNFGGDRLMTRYEFAAMLYRAIENGAALEEKIIKEFEPELGRIRVDRISGEDGDRDKIERVRVNDTKGERDHYGNKLAK